MTNTRVYLGVSDTIYKNESAKMAVIDCNPQNTYPCRIFIIINSQGEEIETIRTT